MKREGNGIFKNINTFINIKKKAREWLTQNSDGYLGSVSENTIGEKYKGASKMPTEFSFLS